MQQLCLALEQLTFWKDFEDMLVARDTIDLAMKNELQGLLQDLTDSVHPLLHGFLTLIDNETDVPYYSAIRRLYLPPLILAYNSARTFAATYLGPETLLPALELATHLAADENAALAEDFVASGMMKPFVKAMAYTSRVLLRLNQEREMAAMEEGKSAGKRRRRRGEKRSRFWMGETVDVWDPTRIV